MDALSFIMDYEDGSIEDEGRVIDGFAGLIKSGMVWSLQGHYGRTAASLIENGIIDSEGNVLLDFC